MNVKGGLPPRIIDVRGLESEKADVVPEGGVVDQDLQHQVGGDAKDQIDHQAFGKTGDYFHPSNLRWKWEMGKRRKSC